MTNRSKLFSLGFYAILCAMLVLSSCSPGARENWNHKKSTNEAPMGNVQAKQDSTSAPVNGFISSIAAQYQDSVRKFIKKADMKFRVNNVYLSTYTIEGIIAKQGGFVTSSSLRSDVDRTETTEITEDSSLESIYYTVSNSMVLRVPCSKLDTTLRLIARQINFLDYRNITAEDVQYDILYNQYSVNRMYGYENRLSGHIKNEGKKLNETANAEETVSDLQKQADEAQINILKLEDSVKFSTINLVIYQRPSIKRQLIANEKNIKAYEPGFWFKAWSALKLGWELLQDFVLVLIKIWFLYIIFAVGFILYKLIVKRKKQK